MNVWAEVAATGSGGRGRRDDVATRLRNPRRVAYGALAVLLVPAVALGHGLLAASAAAAYLLLSPLLWHARASVAPAGWMARRVRGPRAHVEAASGISATEGLVTSAWALATLPLALALAAAAALVLARVAVTGGFALVRFCGLLLLGAGVGAVGRQWLEAAGQADVSWSPTVLACALAWLAGVAAAIAWLGQQTRSALGIAVAEGQRHQRSFARLATRLGRYLAPGVRRALQDAEGIAAGDLDVDLLLDVSDARRSPSRRWLTVCFADVVGFTRLTERLEPEELAAVLDDIQREMARIAVAHGGTVDKFMGDGLLVLFGDDASRPRTVDATSCVTMALAMRAALPALNVTLRRAGLPADMQMRWGVASGTCTVGDFGSDDRLHYTALGRTVNLASRLETAAAPGDILISDRTRRLVEGHVQCIPVAPLRLPGIDWPVEAFRVETRVPTAAAGRSSCAEGGMLA
jgi:class 3 adenylate cyclase